MVVRISDKTQNYSKVTKLLVKPIFFLLFFGYDRKCIYSCTILKGKAEISTAPNAEKNKPISLI